ncbi:hypothetical protein T265_02685 [Opisthorchis viverrini]|uniref:Uncharacterized protein n=1 Tax=Opisthorchis viverrini TaxID=6198 RepID=A0A075AI48_OPIVI|nr:hypothetical protein T265_02685 [Opisthorchis viverrini]KER31009.1 hypothetical protein T265_02685 [Opisthorchis viverrini]
MNAHVFGAKSSLKDGRSSPEVPLLKLVFHLLLAFIVRQNERSQTRLSTTKWLGIAENSQPVIREGSSKDFSEIIAKCSELTPLSAACAQPSENLFEAPANQLPHTHFEPTS